MKRIVYQIAHWDKHFENSKSRQLEALSWVPTPVKQSGLGFCRLMAEPDGAMIYGVFHMIVGSCAQQCRPRAGWVTDDGHHTGTPLAPGDLALKFRRPVEEIERTLDFLSSDRMGWLVRHEHEVPTSDEQTTSSDSDLEVSGGCPASDTVVTDEGRRTEQKEQNRRKTPVLFPEKPFLEFPLKDGSKYPLMPEKVEEYEKSYPGFDVRSALGKARQWCVDNPQKRKTARGMHRFLNGWLGRNNGNGRWSVQETPEQAALRIAKEQKAGVLR